MKEEWEPNGAWIGVVEIPAGMRDDFYGRLNEKTKGTRRRSSSRISCFGASMEGKVFKPIRICMKMWSNE